MVLANIHGARLIFLMEWIYRITKYLSVKATAVIEVLAFLYGLTMWYLWIRTDINRFHFHLQATESDSCYPYFWERKTHDSLPYCVVKNRMKEKVKRERGMEEGNEAGRNERKEGGRKEKKERQETFNLYMKLLPS